MPARTPDELRLGVAEPRTPRAPGARRRWRPVLRLAAVVLVAGAACGGDGDGGGAPEPGGPVEGRVPAPPAGPDGPGTDTPAGTGTTPGPGALAEVAVDLTPVARLDRPVKLVARPGTATLYVAEQGGRVATLLPDGDGLAPGPPALDLTDVTRSGGEQGLLGLAFSPDGATLYVHHTGPDGETRVASYAMDGQEADPNSRRDLLTVDQPYPNHNGGELVVDDAGLLWIALGDGGAAGDPDDRAQDPDDLLGKILRIDPDAPGGGRPYGIPADNPYATGGGRPEIAVSGVRNPWRARFDPATGDLWVADVGQAAWEEITRLPAGAVLGTNLEWSHREGSAVYDARRPVRGGTAVGPTFELHHDDGWCSITGGPVYRGAGLPGLDGAYLFGDFCQPGLSALRLVDGVVAETAVLDDTVTSVTSIDTDGDGEVYVLSLDGTVSRLTAG